MKGILLSLGILIPTIVPSQIPLVPFPGIFSTYIRAHLSKRQFCLRPLSREPFFNRKELDSMEDICWFSSPFLGTFFQLETNMDARKVIVASFRPLSRGFFSMHELSAWEAWQKVFVPFLGDLFFNSTYYSSEANKEYMVFVPFLGDFFSINDNS